MNPNTTAIFLTDEEIAQFLIFQQNYASVSTMIDAGVLSIKNGKAIVSFDYLGRVADIELQYHTFRLKH